MLDIEWQVNLWRPEPETLSLFGTWAQYQLAPSHWSNYFSWLIYRFSGPVLYTGGLFGGHCNNKKLVIREQTSNPAIM